jgi:uncharacterized cofD-like protein
MADLRETKLKKVVVIGGGTGSFTVLSGLKKYPLHLTAVVSMADDGGSTGRLRDEYGVLPPGDIRQCLVALSEASDTMRELFSYRFSDGGLDGHSFGNIFVSTLEKMTGDFNTAMKVASEVLKVRGMVLPVTLDSVYLRVELKNGKVINGEHSIDAYQMISRFGVRKISLDKKALPNPRVIKALQDADMVILGPGSFYTSLIPNLLVSGIPRAVASSKAKKVFIVNLMNRYGHTDNFGPSDYVGEIEKFLAPGRFDYVLCNTELPSKAQLNRYVDEGEPVLLSERDKEELGGRMVTGRLLGRVTADKKKGDLIERALIRHDPDKLARALVSLL